MENVVGNTSDNDAGNGVSSIIGFIMSGSGNATDGSAINAFDRAMRNATDNAAGNAMRNDNAVSQSRTNPGYI